MVLTKCLDCETELSTNAAVSPRCRKSNAQSRTATVSLGTYLQGGCDARCAPCDINGFRDTGAPRCY